MDFVVLTIKPVMTCNSVLITLQHVRRQMMCACTYIRRIPHSAKSWLNENIDKYGDCL